MKAYFKLQYRRANRRIKAFGLMPLSAYLLIIAVFLGISDWFFKMELWGFEDLKAYTYVLVALSVISVWSETRRNEFLKRCFTLQQYYRIRFLENVLTALPFMGVLLYKEEFLSAGLVLFFAVLLITLNKTPKTNWSIPTPFSKRPFEFPIGFRKTFFLFMPVYGLSVVAVTVQNLNLGIFAMLCVFAIIAFGYYQEIEPDYYIWSVKARPREFLIGKMKTALRYSTFLVFPAILILGVKFYRRWDLILIFLLTGYLYVLCFISLKYSAYPNKTGFFQLILIFLSFNFPPVVLILIPYFFRRSIARLKLLES